MTAKILGTGVHHDINAVLERILQGWRGESRVNGKITAQLIRLFAIVSQVTGFARGVEGGLDVDDVPRLQFGEVFVGFKFELFQPVEFLEQLEDAVAAVVAAADGDAARVQEADDGVEGGEAGGVGQAGGAQERGQDGFEARGVGGGVAGVDVGVVGGVGLDGC